MGLLQVLLQQAKVDLGVMAMKGLIYTIHVSRTGDLPKNEVCHTQNT